VVPLDADECVWYSPVNKDMSQLERISMARSVFAVLLVCACTTGAMGLSGATEKPRVRAGAT